MTSNRTLLALDIFERTIDLDGDARATVVEELCGGDETLRGEVLRMLDADADEHFLEIDSKPAARPAPLGRDGEVVGPFRILRILGSGGMGVVYEAEQEVPRRRVALKMLPGTLGRPGAERRFQSEIQLLARLDHPCVARVLEAGVHQGEGGLDQPYFAMEYVPGAVDLITWGRGRSLRERLTLFTRVCDAIQHGHQQGVIHRDLKPANVLVGEEGEPKVIDFGVARAMDEADDLKTRATQAGEIVGTLQYMAPEQLDGDPSIDTRTDVYSLGLLLYELVTGQTPFEFAGCSITEIALMIRDKPPRPLHAAGAEVPDDLGWVILRAVEKAPDRRYSAASELGADVHRFLDHRPVEAGKPSLAYTLVKFVRRHRAASLAAAAALLAVVAGTVVSFLAMIRANDEADKFRSINSVLVGMFTDVRIEEGGADLSAGDLLDRAAARVGEFEDRPELEAILRANLARSYSSLGLHAGAIREANRALELGDELSPVDEAATAYRLAHSLWKLDQIGEARILIDRYQGPWWADHGELSPAERFPMRQLSAAVAVSEGRAREAVPVLEELLVEAREVLSPTDRVLNDVEITLFHALVKSDRLGDAEALTRARLERAKGQADVDLVIMAKWHLARSLIAQSEFREAIEILNGLLPDVRARYGLEHSRVLVLMHDLGSAYLAASLEEKAIPILKEVVALREERSGPTHSETLLSQAALAQAMAQLGDDGAEELLRESLTVLTELRGADHPRRLSALFRLGRWLRQAGRLDEAEPVLVELFERSTEVFTDVDIDLHRASAELGQLRLNQGRPAEGGELLGAAWRGYQATLGASGALTLTVGNNYAGTFIEQGLWGEAVEVLIEVVQGMGEAYEPDDPRIHVALMNLSGCHAQRGESRLALERMREALELAMEHFPKGHQRRVTASRVTGFQLMSMGRAEEGVPYYEQAMEECEANGQIPPLERSELRLGQARCLHAAGRYQAAVDAFETLLEIEKARVGHPESAWLKELAAEAEVSREASAAQDGPGVD